ncbi:MAG TPA: hypothetical protein VGQ04_01900 [Chitinophagaceae bacterium]|jgi:hypothetical protein|nr:hypothetical protein [Chitinophagaceae bacterium]
MKVNSPLVAKTSQRNISKVVLISVSFFLLAIIGIGFWYWTTHKNKIIETELEKAIVKNNKRFYKVSYDDMKIDETAGALSVHNMKLRFDSASYQSTEKDTKIPPMVFNIDIPEINVTGVKTTSALIDKKIIGRKLEIKNPIIDLQYTYKGKDSVRNVPTEEVYRQILGNMDMIQIDSVLITGAQVRTSNRNTGKLILEIKNVDIALQDLKVDSIANADSTRILFSKGVNVNVAKIAWPSPNRLYDYIAENISLNSTIGTLSVDEILISPRLGENAFVNAIPTQDDRFNFSFNNVVFSGIDLQKLSNEYLKAETMSIGKSVFKVYRDLARPRDKKNRVGYYPHQVLDDVPLVFNIKKVNVRNSFVEYKERNHITRQSGLVQFYSVNATITNFTNDKYARNKVMKAFINSSFLNKTPLETNWTFYLFHPKGRFDVSGNMGAIQGKDVNSLAEPMGPASIKEGRFNGLTFDLHGNDYSMNGNVKLLYDDLKVALLEKDKGATETDKKFLTSLLANFVIKNSNPKGDDEVRIQRVSLSRNTNRSLFYLCWKTIFKGIRETVGIKQPVEVASK